MTTKAKYQLNTFIENIFVNRPAYGEDLKREFKHEVKYLISALERQYGFCFTGF